MTAGRLVYLIRRELKREWGAVWHEHVVGQQVERWAGWQREREPGRVPVHVLVGAEQFRLMLWMLASWLRVTERGWLVTVHDDGTLTAAHEERLRKCLPTARLVWAQEADEMVEPHLVGRPGCRGYRARHPLARKIFDVPLEAGGGRYVLLDADVLFFRKPVEILDWVDGKRTGCWFNEDVAEASVVSSKEARAELGVELWPRVNSGVCLIERETVDLDFCEKVFQRTRLAEENPWRIEQTLYALNAARRGPGGLLPTGYEVSLKKHRRPDAVCRHYIGAVRDRFYAEGLGELKEILR